MLQVLFIAVQIGANGNTCNDSHANSMHLAAGLYSKSLYFTAVILLNVMKWRLTGNFDFRNQGTFPYVTNCKSRKMNN